MKSTSFAFITLQGFRKGKTETLSALKQRHLQCHVTTQDYKLLNITKQFKLLNISKLFTYLIVHKILYLMLFIKMYSPTLKSYFYTLLTMV